jgi:small subunit ribosomal protein S9
MATKKAEIEYLATGRRKTAIARVRLSQGKGKVTVNGRPFEEYFPTTDLRLLIEAPFKAIERTGAFDVIALCEGGGIAGQAGALRHGISRVPPPGRRKLPRHPQEGRIPHPRPPHEGT